MVAFQGIDVVDVDVQVHIGGGLAGLLHGRPARQDGRRIAGTAYALRAVGPGALALLSPKPDITINLSPADLLKEGSHYDLPVALGLLVAMGVVDGETGQPLSSCWANWRSTAS